MGMYDEVSLKCPTCGHLCYVQSKVADCTLRTYEQSDVPAIIAEDINEQDVYCEECKNTSSVVTDVFVRVKLQ